MAGKFELYQDKAGEYRFRLKVNNGEIIGTSEGYIAEYGVTKGIKSVKTNATLDERYDVFEGKSGKWYFNLKAANYQIILSSQGYSSKSGAEGGVNTVKRAVPDAIIIE